jgi:hypothetical protein
LPFASAACAWLADSAAGGALLVAQPVSMTPAMAVVTAKPIIRLLAVLVIVVILFT